MKDYNDIKNAPLNGTKIKAIIPYHGEHIISYQKICCDDNDNDSYSWVCHSENPPDCWDDGICWHSNSNGIQSVKPTYWREYE